MLYQVFKLSFMVEVRRGKWIGGTHFINADKVYEWEIVDLITTPTDNYVSEEYIYSTLDEYVEERIDDVYNNDTFELEGFLMGGVWYVVV